MVTDMFFPRPKGDLDTGIGTCGLCSSIFICSCLTLGVLELLGNGATTGIASASSPHSNIEQQGQMEGAGLSLHGYR